MGWSRGVNRRSRPHLFSSRWVGGMSGGGVGVRAVGGGDFVCLLLGVIFCFVSGCSAKAISILSNKRIIMAPQESAQALSQATKR